MSLNTPHLPADSGKASVHAAVRSMQAMVDGELADFVSVVHTPSSQPRGLGRAALCPRTGTCRLPRNGPVAALLLL